MTENSALIWPAAALTCDALVVEGLTEVGQEPANPARDRFMTLDLTGPVAFGGILDQLLLAGGPTCRRGAYSLVVKDLLRRR